ncbi:hypothetical protein AQUCO_04300055v1 [Aquilegia coerulea]|uniref:CRAL/TRIO N-terminal domain-containing protein n=1 Tax=Aquilegia coerulea TaxID=218851 RepID=A0A2G5CPU6_AQUCA|nr:hypothetical protein AQUCO_04300055v1 [Aquilegia coerulea]
MDNISKENKKEEIINMDSSEIMQQKLCLMRSFVEKHDPTSKEVDDVVLKRFLRHRKLDVQMASDAFLKYLNWRKAFVPNGFISELEIRNGLSQKKMFMQGFDKKGRPLAVVLHGKHVPVKNQETLEELKRLMVYTLDKVCTRFVTK